VILWGSFRKNRIFAAMWAFLIILGMALTVIVAGFAHNFNGPYQRTFDSLATSFYFTKGFSHSPKAEGIQSLSDKDIEALKRGLDPAIVAHVLPQAQGTALFTKDGNQFRGSLYGVSPDYLTYRNIELVAGSMFTEQQYRDSARVILLGSHVAQNLFPSNPESAINSTIRVGRLNFRVIGITGPSAQGDGFTVSYTPMTTERNQLLGGVQTVGQINFVATSPSVVVAAEAQVTKILEHAHTPKKSGLDDDFASVRNQAATLANSIILLRVLFYVALGIAILSLIVGVFALVVFMRTAMANRALDSAGRSGATRGQVVAESAIMAGVCGLVGVGAGTAGIFIGQRVLPELAPEYGTPTLSSAVVPTIAGTTILLLALGARLYLGHRSRSAASLRTSAKASAEAHRDAAPGRARPQERTSGAPAAIVPSFSVVKQRSLPEWE
jgi:putative ABC transport system permease protein